MRSSVPISHRVNIGHGTFSAPRKKRDVRCAPSPYFRLVGTPSWERKRPRTCCATNRPKPRSDWSPAAGGGGGACLELEELSREDDPYREGPAQANKCQERCNSTLQRWNTTFRSEVPRDCRHSHVSRYGIYFCITEAAAYATACRLPIVSVEIGNGSVSNPLTDGAVMHPQIRSILITLGTIAGLAACAADSTAPGADGRQGR